MGGTSLWKSSIFGAVRGGQICETHNLCVVSFCARATSGAAHIATLGVAATAQRRDKSERLCRHIIRPATVRYTPAFRHNKQCD